MQPVFVVFALLCVSVATATVEVRLVTQVRGAAPPMTIPEAAQPLLASVLDAALLKGSDLADSDECDVAMEVHYKGNKYYLCDDMLMDSTKKYPLESALFFDIIGSGKKEADPLTDAAVSTLNDLLTAHQARIDNLPDSSGPVQQLAFRQKFSTHQRSIMPRFAEAKVYPVTFDRRFPAPDLDRTRANCYAYATNSKLWGATGCYDNDGTGQNVPLPNQWGDGWASANLLFADIASDPCVPLMNSVRGDGLTDADGGDNIEVAVFAHLFCGVFRSTTEFNNRVMNKVKEFGNKALFCFMDYHYHRRDREGGWSDKNGGTKVTGQFADPVAEDARRVKESVRKIHRKIEKKRVIDFDLYYTKHCGNVWAANQVLQGKTRNAGSVYCP